MRKPINKIEKLLAELCPDGVEFKELGEVGRLVGECCWECCRVPGQSAGEN